MVKQDVQKIVIPELNKKRMTITITGVEPLIFHKFSEKAKRQIWEKQTKKAKTGREERNPNDEAHHCFYLNRKGEISFPSNSVKQSVVGASRNIQGVTMALLRGAIVFRGDEDKLIPVLYKGKPVIPSKEFKEYEDPKPEDMWGYDPKYPDCLQIRSDMVRVGMGAADIRFRPQMKQWSMKLLVEFNADVLSAEQVANLLQVAGFASGLGEWRMEKNGSNGAFELAK